MSRQMNPPTLTSEQRAHARDLAMHARRQRADVRASLRAGRVSVEEVLESESQAHQRMRVADVIRSVPGIGPIRCAEILESASISATKRVGGLTRLQRTRLVQQLAKRSKGFVR